MDQTNSPISIQNSVANAQSRKWEAGKTMEDWKQ